MNGRPALPGDLPEAASPLAGGFGGAGASAVQRWVPRMARVGNITFACENPLALAEFWAAVLGYEVERVEGELAEKLLAAGVSQQDLDGECAARDPSGAGPRLYFQRKEKTPTATAPIHLDINVDGDVEAAIRGFRELGATLVETRSRSIEGLSETWTVMRDPEGNPFCVQGGRSG